MMNGETPSTRRTEVPGRYRPSLRMYHASAKGTGSAIEMQLHPAHDNVDGSIMLRIANQCAVGDRRGPTPTFARFDWEHAICVKLDFGDLCRLLQVLRGECESLEDDRGLYHQTAQASTKILFRHAVDPVPGYQLCVCRSPRDGGEGSQAYFVFSQGEALGLCDAISCSMAVVGFGIPMLVAHDTSAYRAAQREFRDASAA